MELMVMNPLRVQHLRVFFFDAALDEKNGDGHRAVLCMYDFSHKPHTGSMIGFVYF